MSETTEAPASHAATAADEFARAEALFEGVEMAVTCYGSARTPQDDPMYQAAREVGQMLAARGSAVVTGGGPGIMEAAARGASEAGGTSIGLCIELPFEAPNPWSTRRMVFRHLYARKTVFEQRTQAAIVFPGGFGTLDELFELLALVQTGKEERRPVVLFGSSYWNGLFSWLHEAVAGGGFVSPEDLGLMSLTDEPEEAVALALGVAVQQ